MNRAIVVGLLVASSAGISIAGTPAGWKRVDARGSVSFVAPPELEERFVQGIDSQVGRYEAPGIEFSYDYGMYSGCLPTRNRKVRIPGASAASLSISKADTTQGNALPYGVELCAARSTPWVVRLRMSARCATPEHQRVAERILRSVKFPPRRAR